MTEATTRQGRRESADSADPATVLRGDRPYHRIQRLTDESDVRACLSHEAESDDTRRQVIARLNRRLAELREHDDNEGDDLRFGAVSYSEAYSISQHFDCRELCAQLRREVNGAVPGRDEPRPQVVDALRDRLEEVSRG
jgi:hypothetical protein